MRLFSDASSDVSDPWLRRAYALAERGRGSTSPNPMVGCVIVHDDGVVGEGWHDHAGGPHAEIVALRAAGETARGADVYVTLEPCNHHGRTPPCAEALIEAGVSTVVIGMGDPNPQVAGGGADALRAAGIQVLFAADPAPFESQNEAWLTHMRTGRPWVRVKTALTLDGRPALAAARRALLTGEEASSLTMRLRAIADAVVVGASTCAIDDPLLTVRQSDGTPAARQPLRVVLARATVPDPAAVVFTAPGPALALVADGVDPSALAPLHAAGVAVETYPSAEGLRGAMAALGRRGVASVLVEAGAGMFTALSEEGIADELVVYHAGGVAGEGAPPLFLGAVHPATDRLRHTFRAVEAGLAGDDAVTVWRPVPDPDAQVA